MSSYLITKISENQTLISRFCLLSWFQEMLFNLLHSFVGSVQVTNALNHFRKNFYFRIPLLTQNPIHNNKTKFTNKLSILDSIWNSRGSSLEKFDFILNISIKFSSLLIMYKIICRLLLNNSYWTLLMKREIYNNSLKRVIRTCFLLRYSFITINSRSS